MCSQTFRGAPDNDRDCLPWSAFEDIGARLLRDGADTHGEDDLAVEGDPEVGSKCEKVGDYARERGREACA